MRISVAIRDKAGKSGIATLIKEVKIQADIDIETVAKECEKIIREQIMTKTDSPTGKLASHFIAEKMVDGWGVGDIAHLDNNVPYWNHIDKGSKGIGANWQHFLPKGFWFQGRWVSDPTGYSGVKPNTPIEAVNYIASTLTELEIRISSIIKGK